MAANIEFEFLSKTYLPFQKVINLLEDFVGNTAIEEVLAYDDWTLDSHNAKVLTEDSQNEQAINRGKILLATLTNAKAHPTGMMIYKEGDYIDYSLWIDTLENPKLDCNSMTKESKDIYDSFCFRLANGFGDEIYMGAMGVETLIEFRSDTMQTIKDSANVIRWVFPLSSGIGNIKGFTRNKKYTKIKVFDRL